MSSSNDLTILYWLILSLSIVISFHIVIQIFTSSYSGIVIGEKLIYSYQWLSGHILIKEPSHVDEFLESDSSLQSLS